MKREWKIIHISFEKQPGSQGTIQLKKPSDVTNNELARNAQLKRRWAWGKLKHLLSHAWLKIILPPSQIPYIQPPHWRVSCGLIMTMYENGGILVLLYNARQLFRDEALSRRRFQLKRSPGSTGTRSYSCQHTYMYM